MMRKVVLELDHNDAKWLAKALGELHTDMLNHIAMSTATAELKRRNMETCVRLNQLTDAALREASE